MISDCPENRKIARRLERLDRAMRRAPKGKPGVRARVAFFDALLETGARPYLNALGELAGPTAMLGDRSLDVVFEDGDVSYQTTDAICDRAKTDPVYRQRLIARGWSGSLEWWEECRSAAHRGAAIAAN